MAPSTADLAIQAARDGDLCLLKRETRILLAAKAEGDGNLPVLRYLDRGGDPAMPNARGADGRGYTPLHSAAVSGNCEAVRLLLSKGAPVDPLDYRGTPLIVAAAMGQDQVVKILLDHGADPNKVLYGEISPLTMACAGRSLKCVKLLTQAGADVNFKSLHGGPVLIKAVNEGSTDIVKFLLDVGADPNIADRALDRDPRDATLLSNISLCWLRMRDRNEALTFAQKCRMMRPSWSKAWYREGSALRFLKHYNLAVDAFTQALKLDPASNEIKNALREAKDAVRNAARSSNPRYA